ncbi:MULTISPECIES: diguanylate cyclase domain-containing protein [unclassified Bradyrhizobium]|uniref:diguanylate cyclase domain-containing protein n=1 Tax=unclassified Bradyrhizobium TaxID=2631580 RepID=UPI00211E58FA|nr:MULTISPECIES: diguanylate cyclase [unclassified Bradyrhizobium]MDD1531960.1 GGDEF domain-containing protein [Bradyrhizobium sp. WBOS8]MDD1585001.1 GGDEF domain-containing protein [Bradyrhizobium sp. WBOS4]UUO46165.1 GGDEF domain-containing protein [Bradyrhizobium sp. WBOS04]UUO60127.1 GGDEF domain-containing protein [Bradyrhizobium sp. WBOS08]
MTSISLNRKRAKLKRVLGIRARLALLAVILVAPLMFERIRSLEDTRVRQIAQATVEFTTIARHSADAQREVISSVETILKAEAFIRASAGGISKSCDVLRASLPSNLPWIRTLMIAGQDGRIQCATNNTYVGLDLSDRPYFQQAQESGRFVLSDFILSRPVQTPTVMAVYPVSVFSGVADAVVLATVNLDWMSKVMNNLGSRAGITAVLVDSAGTVLAAPADQHGVIGRPLDSMPLMAAIADRALRSNQDEGSLSFLAADGSRRAVSYIRIAGTNARLIASIDEDKVSAAVSRDIRTAYLQLAFVVVFVLLGALIAAEKLVIKPIEMLVDMAKRLGEGDLSARAARNHLPAEFVPLARAFNAMAAQLSQRERELIASNDRLTVMASIDMLSGLANRRGFQSRLDFEWMRAQQYGSDLALLMIDVDHFKLFNDTYGHLEGDSCLTRLGESLSGIAADTMGFAARYGGEEFCLLLPNTDVARAVAIGEQVRATVLKLCLPHITSAHMIVTVSIGVAATKPNESLRPGDLIEAADAALYAAKHRGRNNVVEHGIQAIESGTPDMMMAASA